ncbi:kinase-like domain-containing protein [Lentinula edodes]|nr:kinase-like domain-containing protein [Lentinula edodes]
MLSILRKARLGIYYCLVRLIPHNLRLKLYRHLFLRAREQNGGYSIFGGNVQRTSYGLCFKRGALQREVTAMRFVRKRTTIPVPFIVDYLVSDDNESYLIMELILGETLADQYGSLTEDVCRIIIRDLIDITNELRSIPPPSRPPLVCGLGSIPIDCRRIQLNGSSSFGPFDSVKAFHEELIKFSNLEFPNQETESAALSKIHRLYEKPHRIVFTHNDLHPGNVMVDANFRIVGILDWESSGWMPEYWEYIKSRFVYQYRKRWGGRVMARVFPEYEEEWEVDCIYYAHRVRY